MNGISITLQNVKTEAGMYAVTDKLVALGAQRLKVLTPPGKRVPGDNLREEDATVVFDHPDATTGPNTRLVRWLEDKGIKIRGAE
jgi:hypothetical protein